MLTNDIKKGWRIMESNGWFGTMMDNKKGNIRCATIEGFETETGDIYMHDVVKASPDGKKWFNVEHTPSQKKMRLFVASY